MMIKWSQVKAAVTSRCWCWLLATLRQRLQTLDPSPDVKEAHCPCPQNRLRKIDSILLGGSIVSEINFCGYTLPRLKTKRHKNSFQLVSFQECWLLTCYFGHTVTTYSPPSRRLFLLCESTSPVLEANHPYKLFYHDVQLMFVSVFFLPSHRENWNKPPIHTDFTSINSFERALGGF